MGADGGVYVFCLKDVRKRGLIYDYLNLFYPLSSEGDCRYEDSRSEWIENNDRPEYICSSYGTDFRDDDAWSYAELLGLYYMTKRDGVDSAALVSSDAWDYTFAELYEDLQTRPDWKAYTRTDFEQRFWGLYPDAKEVIDAEFPRLTVREWYETLWNGISGSWPEETWT
jgi:hypothetical protein